jgi:hypothetical protein
MGWEANADLCVALHLQCGVTTIPHAAPNLIPNAEWKQ